MSKQNDHRRAVLAQAARALLSAPKWITTRQAADLTGYTITTVGVWAKKGFFGFRQDSPRKAMSVDGHGMAAWLAKPGEGPSKLPHEGAKGNGATTASPTPTPRHDVAVVALREAVTGLVTKLATLDGRKDVRDFLLELAISVEE